MAYAITLRLDATAAVLIEAMWQTLASCGVSREALDLGYPPHITLTVFDADAKAERLLAAARDFATHWREVPATFASLGLFQGTPATLFLAPIATPGLLERHSALLTSLAGEPVDPHYRRGQFVPHVTLASDVTNPAAAIAALNRLALPITAVLNRLDVVRFRPVEVLASHTLKSQ